MPLQTQFVALADVALGRLQPRLQRLHLRLGLRRLVTRLPPGRLQLLDLLRQPADFRSVDRHLLMQPLAPLPPLTDPLAQVGRLVRQHVDLQLLPADAVVQRRHALAQVGQVAVQLSDARVHRLLPLAEVA